MMKSAIHYRLVGNVLIGATLCMAVFVTFGVVTNRFTNQFHPDLTIPTGSVITGVLVQDEQAPAQHVYTPTPTMLRITKGTYSSRGIRHCHLLISAINDIAKSRSFARADTIICKTEGGTTLEQSIVAYAVSSADSVAGVSGDLTPGMQIDFVVQRGFSTMLVANK